jgi:hypothetical protein
MQRQEQICFAALIATNKCCDVPNLDWSAVIDRAVVLYLETDELHCAPRTSRIEDFAIPYITRGQIQPFIEILAAPLLAVYNRARAAITPRR